MLRRREVETERSTWPHRRIAGKRAVEEETSSSVKKERIASSDPSLTRPGPEEFKAQWCLRGYLDPDVMKLAGSGATQSPTVSQLGRTLSCQMVVSNGWDLQLGDIRGAFLEADALDRKKGSLYSSLPPGGTPGVPDGSVILILGNIYVLNDAPQRWWKTFDAVMTSIAFTRSTFDVCVYSIMSTAGNLEGILCVHVGRHNLWWIGSLVFPKLC